MAQEVVFGNRAMGIQPNRYRDRKPSEWDTSNRVFFGTVMKQEYYPHYGQTTDKMLGFGWVFQYRILNRDEYNGYDYPEYFSHCANNDGQSAFFDIVFKLQAFASMKNKEVLPIYLSVTPDDKYLTQIGVDWNEKEHGRNLTWKSGRFQLALKREEGLYAAQGDYYRKPEWTQHKPGMDYDYFWDKEETTGINMSSTSSYCWSHNPSLGIDVYVHIREMDGRFQQYIPQLKMGDILAYAVEWRFGARSKKFRAMARRARRLDYDNDNDYRLIMETVNAIRGDEHGCETNDKCKRYDALNFLCENVHDDFKSTPPPSLNKQSYRICFCSMYSNSNQTTQEWPHRPIPAGQM